MAGLWTQIVTSIHAPHVGLDRLRRLATDKGLLSNDNVILPKAYRKGIQCDVDDPTFTWRDMKGPIVASATGANRPTLTTYFGNVEEYAFAAGDKYSLIKLHVDHDWAGEDCFIHTHWSHNGTNISGQIVVDYYVQHAQGHGRGSFGDEKNITLTVSGLTIGNTPAGLHRIDEVPLSVAGGSATLLDTEDIEPDSLIIVSFTVTEIPTITGGSGKPFVHFVDSHYLSTNIGTKQRSPDFYT